MGYRQNTYEPTYMDPDNHKFINNAPSQCCDFALLYVPRAIFRSQEILPEILPFLNDLCAMRVVFETGCHFQCPIVSDFLFLSSACEDSDCTAVHRYKSKRCDRHIQLTAFLKNKLLYVYILPAICLSMWPFNRLCCAYISLGHSVRQQIDVRQHI